MTLAGCSNNNGPISGVKTLFPSAAIAGAENYMPEGTTAPAMVRVAPLFVHGDGQGAFGCVMVAPPVFLSEQEALTVINQQAEEYGLKFIDGGPSFQGVKQPVMNMYSNDEPAPTAEFVTFKPDFIDAEHDVSIEFISTDDVKKWNYAKQTISGGTYDTRDAAAQLSESLEGARPDFRDYTAAVLYDPCASVSAAPDGLSDQKKIDEAEAKAREISEEQLKAQAKDFFEWLKSQGVI